MLMLRFVMADVGDKAPHLAKLLQGIMQIVIFSPAARQEFDRATLLTVGDTLLQLTKLRGNSVPRKHVTAAEVADAIVGSLDDIKANVKPVQPTWVHPVVYSLQELIETMFAGIDEDHRQKLASGILF
jgi:hypothetical protein